MDTTASNPMAPHVVHRKTSSDSLPIMDKRLMKPDLDMLENPDLESNAADHAMNRSSGKLPEPSITVEQEAPKPDPNPVPEPPKMDPKLKRLLANRESAKRSRLRKLEYMEKLKREKDLQQARVNLLKPQVSYFENHRKALTSENTAIKERMAALEIQKTAQEAEYRAYLEERNALMTVIMRQRGI